MSRISLEIAVFGNIFLKHFGLDAPKVHLHPLVVCCELESLLKFLLIWEPIPPKRIKPFFFSFVGNQIVS